MSGTEAITVIGLISSVITIIETTGRLYDAANDAQGLHDAFRMVAQNIPLVLEILRSCKKIQEQSDRDYETSIDDAHRRELERSANAVRPIMVACEENARKLEKIFEKVMPEDQANWLERYKKAARAVMPGKKRRVEDLMKEILEKLQLLHTNRFFQVETQTRAEALESAIQQLSDLSPSLPEEEGSYVHTGSGSMNVNASNGIQKNFNQSGGSNNRQYNAEVQHFGSD